MTFINSLKFTGTKANGTETARAEYQRLQKELQGLPAGDEAAQKQNRLEQLEKELNRNGFVVKNGKIEQMGPGDMLNNKNCSASDNSKSGSIWNQ